MNQDKIQVCSRLVKDYIRIQKKIFFILLENISMICNTTEKKYIVSYYAY